MELKINLEITDRWLSVQEIAQYLRNLKETINRWIESDKTPVHMIEMQWKLKALEVDHWILAGD